MSKKITVKDLIEFIYENYYKGIGFTKEGFTVEKSKRKDLLLFAANLTKRNTWP